jgi:transposase InsO family protein
MKIDGEDKVNRWNLEVNQRYIWRDEIIKIIRFSQNHVIFQRNNGELQSLALTELMLDLPVPLEVNPKAVTSEPLFEKIVSPEALIAAKTLQAHLEIAIHGVSSDDPNVAVDDRYDASITTLTARMNSKALELDKKLRVMWLLKKRYEQEGLLGLVDGRTFQQTRIRRLKSDGLATAIEQVLHENKDKSTLSLKTLLVKIRTHIQHTQPALYSQIPSDSTMLRYIKEKQKELGVHRTARQNQKDALTPRKVFGQFRATYPGQSILIDSTKLDLFALDVRQINSTNPKSGWTQLELILAIDVYSRSIVGWRFVPVKSKAIDAAFLLYDILHPKRALPQWADITKWNYFGVPDEIWVVAYANMPEKAPKKGEEIAKIPYVKPTTIVTDNDKVFLSHTLLSACAKLGIHLQRSRIKRPTDKSPVEQILDYVNDNFSQQLPGYKGADVPSRGLNPERQAYYFIDEIDALFAEWVATDYQNHIGDGLAIPGVPTFRVSPNDRYAEGLVKAGFIPIPNLSYFDCLETQYRTVTPNGIQVDYLYYDSHELMPYRTVKSSIIAKGVMGKYPIKIDPRDRSCIYFWDEAEELWLTIPWRGAALFPQPFSESSLSYAKALVLERLHGTKPDDHDFAVALQEMYNRWAADRFTDAKERRVFGRDQQRTAEAKRDRDGKSNRKPKNIPPPPEEIAEDIAPMPRTMQRRVDRFDQVRSPYGSYTFRNQTDEPIHPEDTLDET